MRLMFDFGDNHFFPLIVAPTFGAVRNTLHNSYSRRKLLYVPSPIERDWIAHLGVEALVDNNICSQLLADDENGFARTKLLVRGLQLQANVVNSGGAFGGIAGEAALATYLNAISPGGDLAPLLSRLEASPGSNTLSPQPFILEPLAGGLRDPRWLCEMSGDNFQHERIRDLAKEVSDDLDFPLYSPWALDAPPGTLSALGHYFLLDAQAISSFVRFAQEKELAPGELRPRSFYFDAGASFWGDGFGVKQSLAHFEAMGMRFDAVYAWEMRSYNGGNFFADAPAHIQHSTHYVNMPITTSPNDRNNPLAAIALLARPHDYVVLKLDVDNSGIELELVEQLASNATLLSLVDEFFFEDHVDMAEMHTFWSEWIGGKRRLRESYELFGRLRSAGVLAHSYP